jgi:flagellar hook assembly protein FlgD
MIENPFPTQFKLYSAFPNPFNPVTNLSYSIPENGNVSLIVYDMLGQEVTELVNTHKDAGYHSVQWDATSTSSGIYIVKLVAGNFTQTHKIALVK